jgi:hypothetical protein
VAEAIPGDFTFDSYFTNAEIINHIHAKNHAYVEDLKANRTIIVEGCEWKGSDWIARHLLPASRKQITVGGRTQWYFTKSIRLPKVSHPVRIVVLWDSERARRGGLICA